MGCEEGALDAIVGGRLDQLLPVKGGAVIPAAQCYPSAVVNACLWHGWDVTHLSHGIDDPELML